MLESLNLEETAHFFQKIDNCPRPTIQDGLSNQCLPSLLPHDMCHLVCEQATLTNVTDDALC